MPSTKPLVFDRTKFEPYKIGNLGIADQIYQQQLQPIISTCKTPQDIQIFSEAIKPNFQNGLWAVEKCFFATSLEIQKSFIELTKHTLELLGHLEYITACISGGPNPFNLSGSYAQAYQQNISDMQQFITGFEPESLNSAGQTATENITPILPENVYLGRFNSLGQGLSSNNQEQGKFYLSTEQLIWPQYQNYSEFTNEQSNLVIQDTQGVEEPYRQQILDARPESFSDEWDDMENKNQLKQKYSYLPPNLKKYYRPQNVPYLNQNIDIDLEEDYDLQVKVEQDLNQLPIYIISAQLKSSIRQNNLAASNNSNSQQPQLPDPIPSQSYSRAIKFFFKKTLKIILKKYIPVLIKAKQLFSTPHQYVGDVLISLMVKNFEMYDPQLINRPKLDSLKSKYYLQDIFTLDGITNLQADSWNVHLEIINSKLTLAFGFKNSSTVEQETTKLLLNLIGFSNNFMLEIIEIFSGFLNGIFKVKNIPIILPEFLSYQSFRNIALETNVYKLLGCQGIDLTTMPAFNQDNKQLLSGSDAEQSYKKIVLLFINQFMELPNTILNQKIGTILN